MRAALTPPAANELDEAVDSTLAFATSGAANWSRTTSTYYYDGDSAQSGTISGLQDTWMKLMVGGAGTLSFYWKVSSQAYSDYLEFYIDGARQSGRISGDVGWQQKNYTISGSAIVLRGLAGSISMSVGRREVASRG